MLLAAFILFWFIIYAIEGTHDSYFEKQLDTHPASPDSVLENYYRGKWHSLDSYQFAFFHTSTSLLMMFALSENYVFFFTSLLVSLGVRIFAHDLFYDIGVNRSIYTVPTCQGKWDFWDCLLSWLNKKTYLPPIAFRLLIFAATIILFIVFN